MDPDQHQRENQGVIMCVIVGDVPNSGYILRFTQAHACLRISTKPVDMPEDSINDNDCQSSSLDSIIDVVANLYRTFYKKMRIFQEK